MKVLAAILILATVAVEQESPRFQPFTVRCDVIGTGPQGERQIIRDTVARKANGDQALWTSYAIDHSAGIGFIWVYSERKQYYISPIGTKETSRLNEQPENYNPGCKQIEMAYPKQRVIQIGDVHLGEPHDSLFDTSLYKEEP